MKKNHIITPLLITLTGILVTVGSFMFFRQTPTFEKPESTPQGSNPPIVTEPQQQDQKPHETPKKITTHNFCYHQKFENKSYIVCEVDPEKYDISLFLNNANGQPFKYFRNVEKYLREQGKTIAFAVNGGMYHKDFSAVGLYIENGKTLHPVSTKDGPGNFHMKPNGIFFVEGKKAGVMDTDRFLKSTIKPDIATQSGPMLVIENKIHPRFIVNSPYLEYRNGVGIRTNGTVVFVNSEGRVNFEEFARFFRDEMKTPNALFLDGSISSLYAPEMKRYDWWYGLGPIIAVAIPLETQDSKSGN
ncbi:phosphodiester glycosidase family protein [Bartonella sp. W8122]|uniref:phosphodiester glycosidase family protein n=1 Tax=Bartonella sp. W8122 TaxID=2750930 RepID=UPI001FEE7B88|nr:phosphodiester glycosidase family protein [Bartonella sp. W8122]